MCSVVNGTAQRQIVLSSDCEPEDRWPYCQRSFCVLAVTTVYGGNDGNKSARPAGWLGARDS